MEIKQITSDYFITIMDSKNEEGNYSPLGLFFIENKDGSFIGIDNSDGNAWTENFINKDLCFRWLDGEFDMSDFDDFYRQKRKTICCMCDNEIELENFECEEGVMCEECLDLFEDLGK